MFLRRLLHIHRQEAGQAFVMMILAMTLVFMIGVIVVDFGFWFSGRSSVVNATDQASMSASLKLPLDGAGAAADALAYVQANDPSIGASDIVITFRCVVGDRNHNGLPDTGDRQAVCPQLATTTFTCIDGLCYHDCEYSAPNAKCNTIVVQGSGEVPFGFADTFGLTSGNSAGFTSAACRGSCGSSPTIPLDIVIVLDRTTSMCTNNSPSQGCPDLTNARNAALEVLKLFDPQQQHIALAVIGPSRTDQNCTGANSGAAGIPATSGQAGTWLAVPSFSSDYNDGDGNLNNSSLLVKTVNCLTAQGSSGCCPGTDLGDPLQAAGDLLNHSGRAGVTKGIIFLTDGAANLPSTPGNTGYTFDKECTAQAPVTTSAGDNDGYESPNPVTIARICQDGNNAQADANSGTGGSTTCTNAITNRDRHRFSGFNLLESGSVVPAGSSIQGIEVKFDAWANPTTASPKLCARVSWNGGTTWSSYIQMASNLTASEARVTLGGATNTWGHTWTTDELTNANFLVEVVNTGSNATTTYNLDRVAVAVSYFTPDPSFRGPCDYAAKIADGVRDSGIELYTIGFGVANDRCTRENTNSPYENALTTQLLADMANGTLSGIIGGSGNDSGWSDDGGDGEPGGNPLGCTNPASIAGENADDDHFLCEAKGNDLTPVFKAAAEALAGASRLIKIPPGL